MSEREQFEAWLGTKPNGPAHDLAWLAWEASAARAQPAQAVPMTDAQIEHALRSEPMADNEESFALGIRHAERHHGIVGKEGGA